MKGLRRRRDERLLELDDVGERLKPFGRRYLGVRAIPLDALVGTDSRAGSFTRDFRPLHSFSRDRMRSLEAAFAEGAFPPIVTVKLGETYFERIFLEDSGLAEARPGARIAVSRPANYLELLENVQVHGYHRMRGFDRVLDDADIAADWYESIYEPTLAAIDRLRLTRVYEDSPPGDLFLLLHSHRRDAFPRIGCPHLAQTVVSVIGNGQRSRRLRLPGRR